MSQTRGGVTSQVVSNDVVALGDNEFESGVINIAAGATIPKGTVLKRTSGKFAAITTPATDVPVAVNPFDVKNTGTAAADIPIRAIISGPVRHSLLSFGGTIPTDDQNDKLRSMSIIPIKDHDISRTS